MCHIQLISIHKQKLNGSLDRSWHLGYMGNLASLPFCPHSVIIWLVGRSHAGLTSVLPGLPAPSCFLVFTHAVPSALEQSPQLSSWIPGLDHPSFWSWLEHQAAFLGAPLSRWGSCVRLGSGGTEVCICVHLSVNMSSLEPGLCLPQPHPLPVLTLSGT